jgi:hypothetical protein
MAENLLISSKLLPFLGGYIKSYRTTTPQDAANSKRLK